MNPKLILLNHKMDNALQALTQAECGIKLAIDFYMLQKYSKYTNDSDKLFAEAKMKMEFAFKRHAEARKLVNDLECQICEFDPNY